MMTRSSLLLAVALFGLTGTTHAASIVYLAHLDGPSEGPPNASPGTGDAVVAYDPILHTLRVQVTFSDLIGDTVAAHIHAPLPPLNGLRNTGVATQVPTFSGFPLGVKSGSYDMTFDMTSAATWNPAYITGNGGSPATAEAALGAALAKGEAYLNIHTSAFSGGEIRGFLVPE